MIGERRGLGAPKGARAPATEFRTTMTSPEGLGRTDIFQGRVVGVDPVNWTVDVVSQFDQMRLLQIPVSSPYLHPNRGEGLWAMPEVGSKCVVCWPGDSSPPFVLAFVMPHETESGGASFSGGRPRSKPGDIVLRGRDGNQVVLHRGGVLQIGGSELCQRVYLPLTNLVLDFCERYALHNAGGSINWGIQEGAGQKSLGSEFSQTFRVFAGDKFADIRLARGKVHAPVPDTDTDLQALGIGKSAPIVYELALAPGGFRAEDGGILSATASLCRLRFAFDRDGNGAVRIEGNVLIRCKKRLKLRVDLDADVEVGRGLSVSVGSDAKLTSGGTFEITGAVLRLNGGNKPVAKVGDNVVVLLPPGLLVAIPGPPGFAPLPPGLNSASGTILGPGTSTVLV
jgi:hypothetical protein